MQPTIFLSYRRQVSADLASLVKLRLETLGYDVFLDVDAINGGRFANVIEKEIINRDCFIVLLGIQTLASNWVIREIETALRHNKPIIVLVVPPFSLSTASLPPSIADLTKYDEIRYDHEYREAAFEKLVKAITSHGLIATLPPLQPRNTPSKREETKSLLGQRKLAFAKLIRLNEPWAIIFAAIITGMFTLLAVWLTNRSGTPPVTLTPTDSTAVVVAPTNTGVPASNTPAPSDTPIPPSSTPMSTPTGTPTAEPTNTPVPPTPTPTPTERPTNTPIPASHTPTVTDGSGDILPLTIYRDADNFTIFAATSNQAYSLSGLTLRVTDTRGQQDYLLERFPSFLGLPFTNIASLGKTACFRLYSQDTRLGVALACSGNDVLLFSQPLAAADVFWYDRATNQERTVTVLMGDVTLGICPAGQAICLLSFSRSAAQTVPTASATPGYPCEAIVVTEGIATVLRGVVRSSPSAQGAERDPISVGEMVIVLRNSGKDFANNAWYEIANENGNILGWIRDTNIQLSASCPV